MLKRLAVQVVVLALVATAFAVGPLRIRDTGAAPIEAATSGLVAAPGAQLLGGGANFVSVCRYSHTSQDDPIVFPGVSDATHHHDFFANVSTDADSTYETLQAAGSLCRIDGDTAAYWTPGLFDSGRRIQPTGVRVYYTSGRKNHLTIRPFPAGLQVVAKEQNVRATWACVGAGRVGRGSEDVPTCPERTHLVLRHRFPDCWNGRDLVSDDHTGHMAFSVRGSCPSSHAVPVPALSVNVHYPTDGGDVVLGMPDAPVAPHADFFNAWDQPTLERLVRVCLNAGVHCGARPPTGRALA